MPNTSFQSPLQVYSTLFGNIKISYVVTVAHVITRFYLKSYKRQSIKGENICWTTCCLFVCFFQFSTFEGRFLDNILEVS